jgi:hypothetical protein
LINLAKIFFNFKEFKKMSLDKNLIDDFIKLADKINEIKIKNGQGNENEFILILLNEIAENKKMVIDLYKKYVLELKSIGFGF